MLGAVRGGQVDAGRGYLRAQFVELDAGHPGAGGVQQPAGQFVGGRLERGGIEPVAVAAEQPDGQVPAARVVGEHDDVGRDPVRYRAGRDPGFDARDADGSHVDPLGNEVGAVFGEVGAQPEPGLVQRGAGRARGFGDLAGGHVGVVVQGDGAPLPGGQAGHRAAQRVGAVQVLGRGQAAG